MFVLKSFTSVYFLPGIFCHLVPPCLHVSKCTINSLSALFATKSHGFHNCNRLTCVCVCVLRILAVLVCPQDLWVSSCVGNMTLRPQPVAADGKSTTAKRKRGARRKLSPAGLVAQPKQSVRRVQQQERVGVNVGCTEAHDV